MLLARIRRGKTELLDDVQGEQGRDQKRNQEPYNGSHGVTALRWVAMTKPASPAALTASIKLLRC